MYQNERKKIPGKWHTILKVAARVAFTPLVALLGVGAGLSILILLPMCNDRMEERENKRDAKNCFKLPFRFLMGRL